MKTISENEMYGPSCEECPLRGKEEPHLGVGNEEGAFMIVTDSPSSFKASYGKLYGRDAMNYLKSTIKNERLPMEEFNLVPCVRCTHNPDHYTAKERTQIRKCCRPYLEEAIAKQRPEVIIPLGAEPTRQVTGRAVKIMAVRGQPFRDEERDAVVLPMYNPTMPVLYPQHKALFEADMATLGRIVDNNYDLASSGKQSDTQYGFIDDLQFLIDARPKILAFDTENSGLRWFAPDAKVLTMQFCIEPGKAYMLAWDHKDAPIRSQRQRARLRKQLTQLLNLPGLKVVGQNAKYDKVYLEGVEGIKYKIGHDTLMLATLLDENASTKNLDDLTKRYVPDMAGYADHFNANVDKSDMASLPLDEDFLSYGCGDADATFRLFDVLYEMVSEDKGLLSHYNWVTIPGLNAFAPIELRGMFINEDDVDSFEQYMVEKLDADYRSLLAQVPKSIKRKHVAEYTKDPSKALSFTRPDFVRDILFTHKDGFRLTPKVYTKTTAKLEDEKRRVPSISTKDHLPYFYDIPFVQELSTYLKAVRILGTNIQGFKRKYIVDGKVRPTYAMHTAVTGRTSSEDPNGQNYPKRGELATRYRSLFVAPPGYVIIEADLSQAELRIAADMANDTTMLDIFRSKGDIHTATALLVMGITMPEFEAMSKEEQKLARFKAKAVNFGFIYGMWWRKFVGYAKTQYGVEFTDAEAKAIREGFFRKYSRLSSWHENAKEFARSKGYVRSYSGRIRHLPMIKSTDELIQGEAERQAVNSPVQEFGSSLGVMAMGRIEQEVDPQYFSLVGFVHDAIYAYVPEKYALWGAKLLKTYMETNPLEEAFGRVMRCPITADAAVGRNLGDMHEFGELPVDHSGRVRIDDYDLGRLWNEEKQKGIILCPQKIPPRNGKVT